MSAWAAIWERPTRSLEDLLPHLLEQCGAVGCAISQELSRAGKGGAAKVPHQVRLISVAGRRCQPGPVDAGPLAQSREGPDETLELRVRLRREPQLPSESKPELFPAHAQLLGDRSDAEVAIGVFDLACGSGHDDRRVTVVGDLLIQEFLEMGETLLGRIGSEENFPELGDRWAQQTLEIDDLVYQLGDAGAEKAKGSERVESRGYEMGAVVRLNHYRTLVQPGKPGPLPYAGSRVRDQLMGRTEVDHELGVAVGQHTLAKRGELPLDFPVFLDDAPQCRIGRCAGKAPAP